MTGDTAIRDVAIAEQEMYELKPELEHIFGQAITKNPDSYGIDFYTATHWIEVKRDNKMSSTGNMAFELEEDKSIHKPGWFIRYNRESPDYLVWYDDTHIWIYDYTKLMSILRQQKHKYRIVSGVNTGTATKLALVSLIFLQSALCYEGVRYGA